MTVGNFPPDEEGWQPDAESLNALEAEIPTLAVLRSFADEACRQPWFTELGEPLAVSVKDMARAYLDGLGYPDAEAAPILNWDDALDAALTLDINSSGWEAEEQLRAALVDAALTQVSEEGLGVLLAHLTAQLSETLHELAEEALYMADELPDHVIDLAVGAGQQAAYGAALVLAAGGAQDPDASEANADATSEILSHPLMLKYRLFAAGRWPLTLTGQTLNIF
ncbi:MAG: hypothetical protein CBC43_002765 [Rhizobiales bacterium TMED83]|jgi:hypothetical protein|nr:hypothetical protein [Rhodobiaceae bacterium]RPF94100.1 MAG: hypothetical protein CBC43_002765 [Rhizobiales bacterium TMED83]